MILEARFASEHFIWIELDNVSLISQLDECAMKGKNRFLISYICDNQPNTLEITSDSDTLNGDEAGKYITLANPSKNSTITDIRVVSLHRPNNPNVHPGHYQQPEG